ncbi:histone deacetylase 8-like isoform X2 [Haematobia irritans]|uniref:histone deacetylase 8-like isoform X2 n=1 Tax=Haematobia irritans TaxID=7368 RepID=UPI003F4F8F39
MERNIKYVYSDYLLTQADRNPAVKGRASMTHNLIQSYGLLTQMERIRPTIANTADLKAYHSEDYVKQLKNYEDFSKACPNNIDDSFRDVEENDSEDCILSDCHGLSYDCPPWSGIKDYICTIAGATMTACETLCKSLNKSDVIINWCGGWHHAQKTKAAGFCYVNDIVLGILVLTTNYRRILYLDLDNHHGDGVESAFASIKRVFCLSFHQWECGYYPGTGLSQDKGYATGMGYTANFPYKRGITGEKYIKYFKRIFAAVFKSYQPSVCVIQCGADVIVGDPLGGTNLVPQDLIECIKFVLNYEIPCLFLGGGGYNIPNASRYWCLLTAAICGQTLDDDIPSDNLNFLRYGPDYSLTIEKMATLRDENSEEYLETQACLLEDNLKLYKIHPV